MPLRFRLVALYALILAAVIGAFSALLVVRLRATLVSAVDTELDARARAIGIVAELEDGRWSIERKSGIDDDYAAGGRLYYVVVDGQGKCVLASPLARALGRGAEAGGPRDAQVAGRHLREVVVTLMKSSDEDEAAMRGAVLRIAVGEDMADADATVSTLLQQLAIVGPLVLVASLAGGLLLAGRALRPIGRMGAAAAEISASDLSRRIEVEGNDELARLARTLNATFDRLQEAFDRQTRFTADASHELRTPLSIVAGNVELALKRPRTVEEYRESLVEIQEATQRMQSIVEGLLTLARADAQSVPFARNPVPLGALCEEVVRLHRTVAEQREVSLVVEAPAEVVVPGDADRLRDLVSNLVTNAIRYNQKGGRVAVRVAREDGRALLSVEDTGIGIPAEDLPHVFERFYRVDKARSSEAGGSGLGLAIAKWIVDAHAGTITVESIPGKGTRFDVRLPVSAA